MDRTRLEQQIRFVVEIDKLKRVVRQTLLTDRSRQEDSAEHSWHLAVMAILLSEYAKGEKLDVFRVVKMVLVHDLVEIDAGDTYCYDEAANRGREERERQAADRIFGLLPADLAEELHALWEEFEARESAEAKFAAALDRLQPLLNNYRTGGLMWRKHGVQRSQVLERNRPMAEGAPELWEFAAALIEDAVAQGFLAAD